MRIAHVIGSCASGGAEMFVKSLLPYLKVLGAELELWVMTRVSDAYPEDKVRTDFENSFVHDLEKVSIPLRFVGKRPKRDWHKTRIVLNELSSSFSPNVIHSHLESVSFHVWRSLRKRRAFLVQTIHNTVVSYPRIQRIVSGGFASYVAISERVMQITREVIGEKRRVATILNGIEVGKFRFKRSINSTVNNVVAVGRLTKQKDYPNLLNAYSILVSLFVKEKAAIPRLSIVGDGELRKDIESMIRSLDLEKYVELLGVRKDIPEILRRADIYVMSSEWEGLSIALIEALTSGIPIVATDVGGNAEIVKDGISGLLTKPRDEDDFAEKITRLIENQDLRCRFSREACERSSLFSIENAVTAHVELYEVLINSETRNATK